MIKLPKELTPELLSLILHSSLPKRGKVVKIQTNIIMNHAIEPSIKYALENSEFHPMLNLDTLGRLMKEWCGKTMKCGIDANIGRLKNGKLNYSCSLYLDTTGCATEYFPSDSSQLEAIIKAAYWVAKEKGLLE